MRKWILVFLLLIGISANAQISMLFENIYFETPDSLLKMDTMLIGNIWQIGRPSKTFFDSAYSIPNAIVTDTINFYPSNNLSTFTIKISDPSWNQQQLNRTSINFMHKFDTDSLIDGGYIEVSYNGGSTWTNIANDPNITNFFYDQTNSTNPLIANGNPAYTGRSNGWSQSFIGWCYQNVTGQYPIYLRFVFSSDSIQTNKEGWMIDNIQLFTDFCEGIPEIQNDISISLFPNPISTTATLVINGVETQCIVSLQIINILGQEVESIPTSIKKK